MGVRCRRDRAGRESVATLCVIEGGPDGSRHDPTVSDDDADLVVKARGGDRRALEQLLRNNYDRIYAVCRRLTGRDADAADAAQEAMIAVVRNLERFQSRSQFATWVYRIAVNASLDELRRRSRRPLADLDEVAGRSDGATEEWSGSERIVDRVDVDAALTQLPIGFRAPVVLRDLCGLDYAEIAEVLALPAGTVRSRIARGRAALAARLSPARSDT